MNKHIVLDAFFNQFDAFLIQVCKVFPDEPDFKVYRNGLKFLRSTNPTLLMKEFRVHVLPFEKVIRKRDEGFFLNYPFNEFEDGSEDSVAKVINKIKGLWVSMTPTNKKTVLDFINTFLDLEKAYSIAS